MVVRLKTMYNPLRSFSVDSRKIHSFLKAFTVTMVGGCVIILFSTYLDVTASKNHLEPGPECLGGFAVDFRRNAARDLKMILGDLKRARDYNQPPSAKTMLVLERVLGRLDPRQVPLEESFYQSYDNNTVVVPQELPTDVCFERFNDKNKNDPYYTNAFVADCPNKAPVTELVSIIIDAVSLKTSKLIILLDDIFSRYNDVPVYVASGSKDHYKIMERYDSVTAVRVTSSTPPAVKWARLIRYVKSKYVVVGLSLVAFSHYTNLERLVRVLQQVSYASYVSGATRNSSGHWTVECYQTRLELYGLSIKEGYTNSAEECMYCDAVGGPFLSSTKLLRSITLDEGLPEGVVFYDWFLRVRGKDGLGLLCPDVMFFTSGDMKKSFFERTSWRSVSVKWGVTDVYLPGRISHRFTCEELKLKCSDNPPYFASPPCCVARLSRALREAVAAFDRAAVNVHISRNSVVGSVKGGLHPWETTAYLSCSNSADDIRSALAELRNSGFHVKHENTGIMTIYKLSSGAFNIVLYMQILDMKGDLPKSERETPTRVRVGTGWVPAPPNPGLYARGFQGKGSLQHRFSNGSWPLCKYPSHHACLDHLPIDGSWTRLR